MSRKKEQRCTYLMVESENSNLSLEIEPRLASDARRRRAPRGPVFDPQLILLPGFIPGKISGTVCSERSMFRFNASI
jgi:hypothetical protein